MASSGSGYLMRLLSAVAKHLEAYQLSQWLLGGLRRLLLSYSCGAWWAWDVHHLSLSIACLGVHIPWQLASTRTSGSGDRESERVQPRQSQSFLT